MFKIDKLKKVKTEKRRIKMKVNMLKGDLRKESLFLNIVFVFAPEFL